MSTYVILILGCLMCVSPSTAGDGVPTIAISCGNTPLVTLPKYQKAMSTTEFQKLLSHFWNEDTKVVIVLKDELSLEDFAAKGNIDTILNLFLESPPYFLNVIFELFTHCVVIVCF